MHHRLRRILAALFAFGLLAAACGDDDDTNASTDDTTTDDTADSDTAGDDGGESGDDDAADDRDDTGDDGADDAAGADDPTADDVPEFTDGELTVTGVEDGILSGDLAFGPPPPPIEADLTAAGYSEQTIMFGSIYGWGYNPETMECIVVAVVYDSPDAPTSTGKVKYQKDVATNEDCSAWGQSVIDQLKADGFLE